MKQQFEVPLIQCSSDWSKATRETVKAMRKDRSRLNARWGRETLVREKSLAVVSVARNGRACGEGKVAEIYCKAKFMKYSKFWQLGLRLSFHIHIPFCESVVYGYTRRFSSVPLSKAERRGSSMSGGKVQQWTIFGERNGAQRHKLPFVIWRLCAEHRI